LGAEKFIDIKCRVGGLTPSACVIVATVRAYKYHGGADNLQKHIENVTDEYGLPAVVALNRFHSDTDEEIETLMAACRAVGIPCAIYEGFSKGGAGAEELAAAVIPLLKDEPPALRTVYPLEMGLVEKLNAIASKIYGADEVDLAPAAMKEAEKLESLGYGNLPVCIAKTQYSFSDEPKLLGRPKGFRLHISELRLSAGAGFVVARAGDVMIMPGLPKEASFEKIDIDENGKISGLF
jgi:formate--tetrahydrofolate ligase